MPYVDFQSFFSVLTQISPADDTFGWNIFVANQPVGQVNAGCEKKRVLERTFWGSSRELFCKFELYSEVSAGIRCALCATGITLVLATRRAIRSRHTWPFYYPCNIEHVFFVGHDPNAFWWVALQLRKFAHQATHIWWSRLWLGYQNFQILCILQGERTIWTEEEEFLQLLKQNGM